MNGERTIFGLLARLEAVSTTLSVASVNFFFKMFVLLFLKC